MFHHIRAFLPKIIKRFKNEWKVYKLILECDEKLKNLGPPLPTSTKEKMNLLWHIISDLSENYKN